MKIFDILPVRIVLLICLVRRRPQIVNFRDFTAYNFLLEALVKYLPAPQNRFETWAVARIVKWAYQEQEALRLLMDLNVSTIGVLKR